MVKTECIGSSKGVTGLPNAVCNLQAVELLCLAFLVGWQGETGTVLHGGNQAGETPPSPGPSQMLLR